MPGKKKKELGGVIQLEGKISGVTRLGVKQMGSGIFPSCVFASCKYHPHQFINRNGYLHSLCSKLL